MTLQISPLPGLAYQLKGLPDSLSLKAVLASEAERLSDLLAKGKGPCGVPLHTDKE